MWANSQSAELYEVLPGYVRDAPDAAALQRAVDDHIAAIVERYGGVTDRWDVVNEPLTLAGGELDSNALTETLGEASMVRAFEQTQSARSRCEALPQRGADRTPRREARCVARELVGRLTDAGAPIDGVGLQGHFLTGTPTADELETVMRDWEAISIDVAITELDIRTVDGDRDAPATPYTDVVGACLAVDACR